MRQLRIALLDATHGDVHTSRNFRRELDGSLAEFDVTAGDVPETTDYDAAVVTGSRSSVYWDEPWIEATKTWVREAVDDGVPHLGICWGHQLLATVLGGTVEDMGVYEVGYHEIEHTGDSRLFDDIDRRFVSFTTHSDAVTTLPPGAEALAANEYSNHAFRHGDVFGVQFHPEYDLRTARDLVAEKDLSPERRDTILEGLTEDAYARSQQSKLVFENFLASVRSPEA
ncbi:type 1 glutamine amidotransferase [Natronobiforma cellulositropha]|uniref:type 1 glutamine amidotransferase n=1 Tax=Natronobiforma cellulositropha TaxID=1679076 RepID=UPI0021D5BCF1|nr:type 1 glutamine amidotransferase [Natronobiforma cellulositropha]